MAQAVAQRRQLADRMVELVGFAREARVRDILTHAGWRGVTLDAVDLQCRFPETELLGYLSRMGPVGRALDGVEAGMRQRVMDAVRTAFNPFVAGDSVTFRAACWAVRAQAHQVSPA